MDELADGVGRRLAELTGAEWGMVSAGCAAGLKHVTAACVTGGNPEKLVRIPDLTGFDKTEVIIPQSSRNVYDHAVRNIGVTIITVNTPEELERAINPRTAMIYLTSGGQPTNPLSLEAVAKIAQPKNIPILVDAAAEILTIPSVHLQKGATIVAYSGGKAICGPQCAGLLLGRKDLLMSAWQASAPHHGPGRDNKVGREETLGMVAAVEAWVKRDHEAEWKTWLSWLDNISKRVSTIESVKTSVREPTGLANRSPSLTISWDPAKLHITGEEVAEELARSKPQDCARRRRWWPRRRAGSRNDLDFGHRLDDAAGRRQGRGGADSQRAVRRSAARKSVTVCRGGIESQRPVGRGDRVLQQQEPAHVVHRAEGELDRGLAPGRLHGARPDRPDRGHEVKLRSSERRPGDNVTFIFAGTVSGNTISGPIYMGEYLNAKFTAKRHDYPPTRPTIRIPTGPPLAT